MLGVLGLDMKDVGRAGARSVFDCKCGVLAEKTSLVVWQ